MNEPQSLRDKIAEVISTGARWRDKGEYVLADAILALDEAKGWAALEAATEALANAEDRIAELTEALELFAEGRGDREEALATLEDNVPHYCTPRDEAAIFRAYQMGLDAAADWCLMDNGKMYTTPYEELVQYRPRDKSERAEAIRALTPPADLVERVKGGE